MKVFSSKCLKYTRFPLEVAEIVNMDVQMNPPLLPDLKENKTMNNGSISDIINYLINDKNIYLKNQQRDESDLSFNEKSEIIQNVYDKGAETFLLRFGHYLKSEHLQLFSQFENNSENIKNLLEKLTKTNEHKAKRIRNRRYGALKQMIENESYFSEMEMMKRNPLLYEQLVGQYLTPEEKKQRDSNQRKDTLVGILMEGIERNEAETKLKKDEIDEINCDNSEEEMSECDTDDDDTQHSIPKNNFPDTKFSSQPSCSLWGEFTNQQVSSTSWDEISKIQPKITRHIIKSSNRILVTAPERELFKQEFITTMYENFLEGKDDDFDYTKVDENEQFDDLDIIDRDEEEKYFDSEEPEDNVMEEQIVQNRTLEIEQEDCESSEDELDIYMSALNQNPTVSQLSKDIEKMM